MAMQPNTASIYISAKDETKAALKSISSGFTGLATQMAGLVSVSALVGTAFVSLKKYADMMDFEKFGIGTDKALVFVDTLKLAGMEMQAVDKAFTELTVNVEKGIHDEKIRKTFSDLGVSMDKLKNAPIGDIYDEVFKKLGQIEDKAKGLALAKEVFGKNGVKIFDAAQDGEIQRYKEYMSQFANEVKLATKEADNLFKNLDLIKEMLKNQMANSLGPMLIPLNALLSTFKEFLMDVSTAKTEFELIAQVEPFAKMTESIIDFINIFSDGIGRATKIIEGLWAGFLVGVDVIHIIVEALGAIQLPIKLSIKYTEVWWESLKKVANMDFSGAIAGIKNMGNEMQSVIDKQFSGLNERMDRAANNSRAVWDNMGKAFDLSVRVTPEIDKNKFKENLKKEIEQAESAMKNTGSQSANRTGIGFDGAFKDQLDKQLKMLQLVYEREKFDIDMLQKYNEMYRQSNLKGLEDYYSEKKSLMDADYQALMKNLQAQLAIAQKGMSGNIPEKDRINYQEKVLEIQNKIYEAEQNYQFAVKKTNNEELNDRINKKIKDLEVSQQLQRLEESVITAKGANNKMDLFAINGKIVESRMKELATYENKANAIAEKLKLNPFSDELKVQLAQATAELENFRATLDPLANEINQAFTGAMANFFSDIVDGSKSATQAFLDMGKQMERVITNLVAQALAQNLMGALFGSGGPGSIFTSLFSKGLFGGGLFGSDGGVGGALATGGFLDTGKGKPYLVGEKGPELFFPGQSGYVMNNSDTQNALSGGGSRPIVMNITTQDADSFRASKGQILVDMNRAMIASQRNM